MNGSNRVTAMEDEKEYAVDDESDSESEFDEDDEEAATAPPKSRELYLLFCIYWIDCLFRVHHQPVHL